MQLFLNKKYFSTLVYSLKYVLEWGLERVVIRIKFLLKTYSYLSVNYLYTSGVMKFELFYEYCNEIGVLKMITHLDTWW